MVDFNRAEQACFGRLDIQLLQSLLAIAHSPTLSSAAQRLNIPQPTMSLQMKRLEERAGKMLFEPSRRGRPLKLSVHGERLVLHAERVLEAYEDAIKCLNCDVLSGPFALGIPELICEAGFRTVLTRFENIFSDVNLTIIASDADDLKDMLANGKIDARICVDETHTYKGRILWSEPFVWASANAHIMSENESLPVALLNDNEPFKSYVAGLLNKSGKKWHEAYKSDSFTKILTAVLSGKYLSALPQSLVNKDLMSFDLKDDLPKLEAVPFAIYKSEYMDENKNKIADFLGNFVEEKMKQIIRN